jgi:hypothetical protein
LTTVKAVTLIAGSVFIVVLLRGKITVFIKMFSESTN